MRDRINLTAADDACPLCGYWRCRCPEVLRAVLRAVPTDSDPDMDEALRRVRQRGKR
ncbi:hypothetical protein SUDANB58_05774 (plasmid) [Streptomyces sp. enrichment culture]|uniref:hypothetical protein n=1 Tax=Streptomyces sp. enrichment culture TaxID=1795815 RepID=UPI003F555DB8